MSNRIVKLVERVDLMASDRCEHNWLVKDASQISPIMLLANTDAQTSNFDIAGEMGVYQVCNIHNTCFSLADGCPRFRDVSDIVGKAGDTLEIPAPQAEWLVSNGMAVYPTHVQAEEEGVDQTIAKTNAILDQMGLPTVDAESMRTIRVEGKQGSKHYARPRDKGLANDLGLSPEDIANMRGWGSAK